MIMLAIVNGRPRILNLREILDEYLKHQKEVVTRRTIYDKKKAEARAHILEGYKIALDHIDDIKEVPLSMMTTRMFRHIGRIIENELPIRNTILTGVEHKLKQKLIRKRSATGHREDDHSLRF